MSTRIIEIKKGGLGDHLFFTQTNKLVHFKLRNKQLNMNAELEEKNILLHNLLHK
jgi:hypothetical protein